MVGRMQCEIITSRYDNNNMNNNNKNNKHNDDNSPGPWPRGVLYKKWLFFDKLIPPLPPQPAPRPTIVGSNVSGYGKTRFHSG